MRHESAGPALPIRRTVHDLVAWWELTAPELARLAAPLALSLLALILPRLRASAIPAGLTPLALVAWGLPTLPLALAWGVSGLAIAAGVWQAPGASGPRPSARAAVEGVVLAGMLLGAWCVLLVAAVARQNPPAAEARQLCLGVLLLGVGMLHVLARRELARAALAAIPIGLGLAMIELVARETRLPGAPSEGGRLILLGTLVAAVLALRLAAARAEVPGSVWVSDAHDLHD
jgi:hypothetical protein